MGDYSITAVDRRVVYSGSAGTGPYAFNFPVLATTDIAVYKDSTKLTEGTGSSQYQVTLNTTNGTGSVTLNTAATGSNTITITGARTIERTTDFVTAGDLLRRRLTLSSIAKRSSCNKLARMRAARYRRLSRIRPVST